MSHKFTLVQHSARAGLCGIAAVYCRLSNAVVLSLLCVHVVGSGHCMYYVVDWNNYSDI